MKKLSIVLAAMLVLALLCSCAKPAPEAPAQADPEPEAPAAVHVTTFPAEILSAADDMLMVDPTDADSTFGAASSVAVRLADGLVPVGADGWPIAVSELTPELQVDITYLGDIAASDPPEVLAVAIRVIPTEQPTTEPDTTTPVQPAEPEPEEPVYEPFATVELPAQDPVPAEIPYDGVTLYGFPAVRTEIVRSGEADLDTDGAMETVQLLRIWLADLDADACPEIYFCGDMASDDYVLNAWSCKSGTPELIPFEDQLFLEASILSISEGSLQLESTQDVLGSYEAVRAYVLRDGVLVPLGDAWQIVPANTSYSRLSLVRDLPVTLDDGTESTFGPGTILQVTGTDGKSFVDVITEDGVTGRIAITQPAGDWQWYINGEPELEYFELVPYAG